MPKFWCGIDWSESLNDVAVIDESGELVAHTRVEATPEGVKEILALLRGLRTSHTHSRKQVPVAIETPHGLLVAALRAKDQPVIVLHAGTVARYRGRISPARKKSDRTDAALLANIVRTDGAWHRPMPRTSQEAMAVTVLARAQRKAVHTRQYHRNQLRSLLRDFYPAALEAWQDLPHGIVRAEARALLALAPTPGKARELRKRHIADTIAAAGRTRLVDDHAERLRAVFQHHHLRHPPHIEEAMGQQVQAALALLNQACASAEYLTEAATTAFHAHPHAEIYASFPGCGSLIGARLLGEIGDDPDRFTVRGLRAYAGAAPLTWESSSSRVVTHRRMANSHLKEIGHIWAFATLTRSPGCRAHYDRRREQGDRYAAALRNLYGRLLSCLHFCLKNSTTYRDETAFPGGCE
ncbi:IS110 family transposase [Streptomyces lydicus]|uniref:IS110 family transposase n=1 Tax=Streptomyces lydicus TaxID=47763 RepID=UPI00101396F6|nr:transposase [Streptomyces lydicus]MCZ1006806.1 transposase [Streptomyces lydicus]